MRPHEITLQDGTVVHGYISFIDHYNERFYVHDQYTMGMIGAPGAGKEFRYDECRSVYALQSGSDKHTYREANEQIAAWRAWAQVSLRGRPL